MDEKVAQIINSGGLTQDQGMLLKQAVYLLKREKERGENEVVVDYGFLVFTAAKVYEGFLKYYFFQLGLISKQQLHDQHFRIGKALNPDLPKAFRNHTWLYDDLLAIGGDGLAKFLWETWKQSRNQIFHYFPDEASLISIFQAQNLLEMVISAMWQAMKFQAGVKGARLT